MSAKTVDMSSQRGAILGEGFGGLREAAGVSQEELALRAVLTAIWVEITPYDGSFRTRSRSRNKNVTFGG